MSTTDEAILRRELRALGAHPRGRTLLQLALRGVERGERDLTVGCWTRAGEGGCLFQHAWWQGRADGTLPRAASANEGIERFIGSRDYRLVVRTIVAFDRLGRRDYLRRTRGRLGLPRRVVDQAAWRATVERLLLDTLADVGPSRRPVPVPAPHGGPRA